MGRPPRTDIPGGRYHVVNRGVDGATIFRDDRDRVEFERLLGVAHDRFGVSALAYCWMSNHYHVVLECPDGGLSDAMHLVGSVFVRHTNERHGRDGPLFTDRFYARPILSIGYLLRCVRYVHRNPTAFMSASELESFRWSSLRAYLGHRRPPSWLATHDVIEFFGGVEGVRRLTLDDDRPRLPMIDPSEWLHAVDLVLDGTGTASELDRSRRTVAALALDLVQGGDEQRLAAALGYPNPTAARAARYRARKQAARRPDLVAAAEAVVALAA